MAGEKHIIKTFRLTAKLDDKLQKESKKLGISQSAYIRRLLEDKPTVTVMGREERELYTRLLTEINRIGVNINQIVKNVNSHFYSREEKKELYELLKKVYDLLKERGNGKLPS